MASAEDDRPPKRTRKNTVSEPQGSAPVGHVFIADGTPKKQASKKPPLSCAECRRLKLKCDRAFPCKSCTKRGCADICPEGVLVSGKGTRFILANTEQLHAKIGEMSRRIRSLEDSLQVLQSASSSNPHPLLHADLLTIKSTLTLYGDTQTGSSHDDAPTNTNPDTPHRGPSPESSVDIGNTHNNVSGICRQDDTDDKHTGQITRLNHDFPLAESLSPETGLVLRSHLRHELPTISQASYLLKQVQQHAIWQYNPHPCGQFIPDLLRHVYDSPLEDLCPRRLSLLFMIIAIGYVVDPSQPPNRKAAENCYRLARASLCEISILENTSVDAILVLFYMTWYLLEFSNEKNAANYAWSIMGLTVKLAQSIGLHRDVIRSKVPKEIEKRRALLWELLHLDARLSLSLGRPPSLFLSYSNCPRPNYLPDEGINLPDCQHRYQEWRHSHLVHCLEPVLSVISSSTPNYIAVLEHDKKLRDFYIPPIFHDSERTVSRPLTMQKASLSMALETLLLQLHRPFFSRVFCGIEAVQDCENKYAPSIVAVVLSASRMIATMDWLFHREPELSVRLVRCWTNTFSAAATLSLLVSRAPFTCLSPAVLQELERARAVFKSAKDKCPQASQVLPMLERMIDKANYIYVRWAASPDDDDDDDEPSVSHSNVRGSPKANDPISHRQSNGKDVEMLKPEQQPKDDFRRTHPDLMQCIIEVHQRARMLFSLRKACRKACLCKTMSIPHPPANAVRPTVLPELYTERYAFSASRAMGNGSLTASEVPESRTPVKFDFGEIDSSWGDQGWMAWF